ncbi:MAG: leucine-rich repeat protein [Clostridiales bacterium]|nr:leucine-rich repeat protein [Clostridiales bacterium]
MRRHFKRFVSLLTAVIMLLSMSMAVLAKDVEMVDHGEVDMPESGISYTWEYYDNDVLKIIPTDNIINIQLGWFTDYIQETVSEDTQILIVFSNKLDSDYVRVAGLGCPASEIVFSGDYASDIWMLDIFNFDNLNSVKLKAGMNIDYFTIAGSSSSTSLDIVNGGNINYFDLYTCFELQSFAIPKNVKSFYISDCLNVESLVIPETLESLTVDRLASLDLENLELPDSLKRCRLFGFDNEEIVVPNNIEYFSYSSDSLTSAVIEEGRTEINSDMFLDCNYLTQVEIPDGVTTIGNSAFDCCFRLRELALPESVNTIRGCAFRFSGLEYFDIPRGVTSIEYYTFSDCYDLKSVTIPNSVTRIDDTAFNDCYSLTDIYFEGSASEFMSIMIYDSLFDRESEKTLDDVFPYVTNVHYSTFIGTGPVDFTGPVGSDAMFTVFPVGALEDYTYQWQYYKDGDWVDLDDETAQFPFLEFAITEAMNGMRVRCAVTDSEGMTLFSNEAKLKVKGKTAKILGQPSSDMFCNAGNTEILLVSAEGDGLKYQWQVLKPGAEAWVNCSMNDGAKTSSLSIAVKDSKNGWKYKCVITDKYGNTVETDPVVLYIGTELKISTQPEDYTGRVGETAEFTVAAQGDGLKYQWQVMKNGEWTNCSKNDGAKTATLTQEVKDSRNGFVYHCVITDKNGIAVTSDEVTLTVDKSLRIVEQPVGGAEEVSVPIGIIVIIPIKAEGDGLKYQWQVLKNGTWTNCSMNDGAKTNTLVIEMKESRDGSVYHCVVSDKYGNSETSHEIKLTTEKVITVFSDPADCYANLGDNAEFTIEAYGFDLKYQWQVLKKGVWTNCSINDGAKTDTLTLEAKESRDGCQYRCVITDKFENVHTTETVTLYIIDNALPAKAVQVPADATVIEAEDSVAAEEVVETVDTVDTVETVDIVEEVVAEVIETEAVTEED